MQYGVINKQEGNGRWNKHAVSTTQLRRHRKMAVVMTYNMAANSLSQEYDNNFLALLFLSQIYGKEH
jgi:hypothetical protein